MPKPNAAPAALRSMPAHTPPKMVLPLRLMPGSMPSVCMPPMASASLMPA